jgi:TRAP-type mannitol/chloroaromatic compound transport system permease small subunit
LNISFSSYLDRISKYSGYLAAMLVVVLSILVVYDAGMRYLFSAGSIALQEVEWHLFDVVFLLGLTYALKHDKHVRVDIFFERYSLDVRCIVQILSMLLLVIPFSLLFLNDAFDMTMQSYLQHEVSSDPGGLTNRWMIKAMLVVAFVLLILQALSEVLKAYHKLENKMLLIKTLFGVALVATLVYIAWYNRMAFWFDPVLLMFGLALVLLMTGFQVAFVFAGVALFFALISDEVGLGVLEMLPYRTWHHG